MARKVASKVANNDEKWRLQMWPQQQDPESQSEGISKHSRSQSRISNKSSHRLGHAKWQSRRKSCCGDLETESLANVISSDSLICSNRQNLLHLSSKCAEALQAAQPS